MTFPYAIGSVMAIYRIKLLNLDMVVDTMNERFVSNSVETNPTIPVFFGVRSDNFTLVETVLERDAVYALIDTESAFWQKYSNVFDVLYAVPQGKIKSAIFEKNGIKTIQMCTVESVELTGNRHVDCRIKSIGNQILDETVERIVLSEDDVDE